MKRHCESCRFQRYAEKKPYSLISRIWRWHTKWCPMWKSYQKELARQNGKETG